MTAEQIRSIHVDQRSSTKRFTSEEDFKVFLAVMLQEIAAQLAELNERSA